MMPAATVYLRCPCCGATVVLRWVGMEYVITAHPCGCDLTFQQQRCLCAEAQLDAVAPVAVVAMPPVEPEPDVAWVEKYLVGLADL